MPFIGYPSAFLYPRPEAMRTSQSVEHYPWGYWVSTTAEKQNGFVQVRHRWEDDQGNQRQFAWVLESDLQAHRLLEVNFVDIGQGDGAFLVFPNDQRMLIDAGEGDNMYRFLRWRFNRKATEIHHRIISHPDQGHYGGLRGLVNDPKFTFGEVYHNGIVERAGGHSLGPRTPGAGQRSHGHHRDGRTARSHPR